MWYKGTPKYTTISDIDNSRLARPGSDPTLIWNHGARGAFESGPRFLKTLLRIPRFLRHSAVRRDGRIPSDYLTTRQTSCCWIKIPAFCSIFQNYSCRTMATNQSSGTPNDNRLSTSSVFPLTNGASCSHVLTENRMTFLLLRSYLPWLMSC